MTTKQPRSRKAKRRGRLYKDPIVGQTFGKLLVMRRLPDRKEGARNVRAQVLCQCECGKRITISRYYIMRRQGPRRDCGCEKANSITRKYAPEYAVWSMMQKRCYDPDHVSYKDYGGRGIRVGIRWLGAFENFVEDMGPRPSTTHTLDRIDVDGNYGKDNCRWATPVEQAANKREK